MLTDNIFLCRSILDRIQSFLNSEMLVVLKNVKPLACIFADTSYQNVCFKLKHILACMFF